MLIGVDVDPGESVDRISSWGESNGFFWPLAPVSADPLKDYRVSQQSAAVGIDASGEIVLRKNGGLQGEDKWRDWLTTLSGRTASAKPEVPSTAASVPAAPASVEAVPTTPPAAATVAPVTQPVQPAPTVAVAAPTAAAVPRIAPPPFPAPAPTITPSPIPTARTAPTVTPSPIPTPTPKPQLPLGSEVGNRAHDFTVTAVNGETYTLSEVNASGKAVIVYFFATW